MRRKKQPIGPVLIGAVVVFCCLGGVISFGAATEDEPPAPSVAASLPALIPTTTPPTPSPSPTTASPKPTTARPKPSPTRTTSRPKPSPTRTTSKPKPPSTDTRYGTCAEANDHGLGPYYRGEDPEYYWYRDRDGDGVVCER